MHYYYYCSYCIFFLLYYYITYDNKLNTIASMLDLKL